MSPPPQVSGVRLQLIVLRRHVLMDDNVWQTAGVFVILILESNQKL